MKVSGNTVALEVDARNVGRWRRCATIARLDMPDDWAQKVNFGIIAQTSAVSLEKGSLELILGGISYTCRGAIRLCH